MNELKEFLNKPVVTEGVATYVTNALAPKCEDGWTLVMNSANRPMCAHELREPR